MQDQQFSKAAKMALDLGHPGQLMATIVASMEHRSSHEVNSEAAQAITQGLPADSIKTLLRFLRQWNTNPRHCHAAQHVLQSLLRSCSAQVSSPSPALQQHTCVMHDVRMLYQSECERIGQCKIV